MYKLLATDLDGTLIGDDFKIPEINKEYIKKAIDKGINFCLCSGRSYMSLERFERELGIIGENTYGICYNGGVVYETLSRKVIRDVRLSRDLAIEILSELKKFDVGTVVYVGDKLIAERETEVIKTYVKKSGVPLNIIGSFEEIQDDISKVLVKGEYSALKEVESYMHPLFKERCNDFFTANDLYEFTNLNATKGEGIKFLANHLGVNIGDVIAVGDNLNDLHMIEAAGLGVAVNNSVSEAKAIANYVTENDNNNGAVAEVIKKFVL